ncbi:MoxR-like ATPase [Brevibacterium sp. 239c]|uniref:AAA family ATPase n=1 Tax=Brevibacterium sp. 239c TaxID=1965356 RepID=UPI000C4B38E8|nr:MoxR family ATPase [Brevibacterium sp. 239c]SMX68362.1 MoxR-like ATPase [Brevibacterium sp. 239c]
MTQTPGENSAQQPQGQAQPTQPAQAQPQSAQAQAEPSQPAQSQAAQPGQPQQAAQERDPLREAFVDVRTQIAKAVVGQDEAVTGMLIALLCQGHVLLEGVPGVAKTLLVRSFATSVSLDNTRIQFTPDLMPSDVTGSLVYDASVSNFEFRAGPVFTNILIADEINRTPPKTQSALLEAMEEHQVSVGGGSRALPEPFMVAATQNPLEYEGTYPLPEAQLDRFLFKLVLGLPERDLEFEILDRHARGFDASHLAEAGLTPVVDAAMIAQARERIAGIYIAPQVITYIVDLARATRQAPSLALGVSPRGATRMLGAARAYAWLSGRGYVTPDDVKALAHMTLSHRVILRPEAQMDGLNVDQVLNSIIATTEVPR